MSEILFTIIVIVIIAISGAVVGWLFGYRAGYYKVFKDTNTTIALISECTQCGAIMPDHYHGCPIAAEFRLITLAKS